MKIYAKNLAEKMNPVPIGWDRRLLLNESQVALLIGYNRRQLLRWRHAGVGPQSADYETWTAHGNARFYRLGNLIAWVNEITGEGETDPDTIILDWLRKYIAWNLPQPGQPSRVEPWRTKPEPLWKAQSRKTRQFEYEMARIEYAVFLIGLREKENAVLGGQR